MGRRFRLTAGVAVLLITFSTFLAAPAPAAVGAGTIRPGHKPYPGGGTRTVGDGITRGNTNSQLAETVPARIRASWRAQPRLCPGSGNDQLLSTVTVSKITVALDHQASCSFVSAYRTSTGRLLWRKKYLDTRKMVSDGTTLYLWDEDVRADTWIHALRLRDGRPRWTTPGLDQGRDPNLSVGSGVLVTGSVVL